MFSDRHPMKAAAYLNELQLFWVVFSLPPNSKPAITEGADRFAVTNYIGHY